MQTSMGFGHSSKNNTELLNFFEKRHGRHYISGISVKVNRIINMETKPGAH